MWQELKNYYHLLQAIAANVFYGFPARELTVIGVTGTDGKTTTVNLIYHILKHVGYKVSMISTISAVIGGKTQEFGLHVTTPDAFTLQRCLRLAVDSGSKYMVLEVTSHALDQYRVFGIDFAVGVLTNITREHFDYHKTYDRYVEAKSKLLNNAKRVVLNRDDNSYKFVEDRIKNHGLIITYGIHNAADIMPEQFQFQTKLIGEFNTYNILSATAACRALKIKDEVILKGIRTFQSPVGRAEIVHEDEFTVIVDFAHTPNALKQILLATRNIMKDKGRLIHVFGSAGERDRGKRPQMGEVSAEFADIIILTSDDPRSESVEKISDEIAVGISKVKKEGAVQLQNVHKIPDRQEAINKAIKLAGKDDFVVITGIGHVRGMPVKGKEIPWSEHEAVSLALKLKMKNEK